MINNVFYVLAVVVLLAWLCGVPAAGFVFFVAKFVLVVTAIMVLAKITLDQKLPPYV